jgi:hypothetical protein
MSASDDHPSETSPLLGPGDNGLAPKTVNGTIANGSLPDDVAEVGSDLARHDSVDESRAAQFEGRPDIQKQLKYIIPAISIGVTEAPDTCHRFTLNEAKGLFVCR